MIILASLTANTAARGMLVHLRDQTKILGILAFSLQFKWRRDKPYNNRVHILSLEVFVHTIPPHSSFTVFNNADYVLYYSITCLNYHAQLLTLLT